MSMPRKEMITCPQCGKEAEFTVWGSINTMLDPEMKEMVRNDEAFVFTCPDCGSKNLVDYPTLYHQMEDNIMIHYAPGENADKALESLEHVKQLDDLLGKIEIKTRVVSTRNDFKEKLKILDEGLDDRVIEIMKLYMGAHLANNNPDLEIEEFHFDVDTEGERCFSIGLSDGRWASTDYAQDMYDGIMEAYGERIDKDKSPVVDYNWAIEFIGIE